MVDRLNSPQRWNSRDGWGVPTIQGLREYVPRCDIEAAACRGYNDAAAGLGFCSDYAAAPGSWQRNYEIGRLWAVGFARCGFDLPPWPEKSASQVPWVISKLIGPMNAKIGPVRPESQGMCEPDPDLPILHRPLPFRRRGRR